MNSKTSDGRIVLSIIIIVKNDRGIANTLNGLRKQEKTFPTEIIVVDASNPETLADIRCEHTEATWYQFTPRIPNKTSIPEQRNFGIQHAQGDIMVFIDANCIPPEHWLRELTTPILDGTETMTAGSVRASDPKMYVNTNPENDKNNGYLTSSGTGNLAFKKELWEKVGKFDESFLFGSDVDFTWRCSELGNKILFVRHAYVTHDWGTFADEIKRSFKYGKARAYILKKHPGLFRELLNDNLYIFAYTIYFLLLPLTIIIWWYPLVIVIAFLKNINSHPFKTVFLNMIYTVAMWITFAKMLF